MSGRIILTWNLAVSEIWADQNEMSLKLISVVLNGKNVNGGFFKQKVTLFLKIEGSGIY